METLILIVLLAVAAETSYLTVRSVRRSGKAHLAPVFVDTSVLIDGRITFIAESGFLTRPLYIPRSVVGELQFLADNGDTEKRTRARHGLDVISQLQAIEKIETVIFPDGVKAEEGVDNRLLSLAKKHSGSVCTIDYNLNKVAVVEGIEVLNVNELTKSLRMAYLPGEHITIAITQKGNDTHQGVGHLEDGTMVVVENAGKYVGKDVEVEFIRSLQTSAGKMMFAKLVQTAKSSSSATKPLGRSQAAKSTKVNQSIKSDKTKAPAQQESHSRDQSQPKPQAQPKAQTRPKAPLEHQDQRKATSRKDAQSQAAKAPAVRRQPNNRRRKSPEDSLMELVNNS